MFWMRRRAKSGRMFQQRVRTFYQARENAPGEAAVLRLLADVYIRVADRVSAIRCLERVVFLATHLRPSGVGIGTWNR